jgi:hypothetical protein
MRQSLRARLSGLGALAAAAAVVYACGETQTPPTGVPDFLFSENPDVHLCENTDLEPGKVKVIKVGGTGEFEVVVHLNWTGEEIDRFNVTVEDGECAVVHLNESGNFEDITNVTVTETSPNFVSLEWSIILLRGDPTGEFHFGPQTDPTFTAQVNQFKGAKATYLNEEDGGGGEGCTPGFWRQSQHLQFWAATGLSPSDDFDTTFGVNFFSPDITLLEAVSLGGGGVNKVARHGTAALLNALHPDVDYAFTAAEVIAAVQAQDVDALVAANEAGCDLTD